MAALWVVFAAAFCILGRGYAAPWEPCEPTPIIIEEIVPCGPMVNVPCDGDGKPIPLPSPLSFPIPVPPPLPSSSIFSLLAQAQNGDPNDVLPQISKLLASTLPPHIQAAAAAQPPPEAPCDSPVSTPPLNTPIAIAPPCNTPTPIAPPCNTPISVAPPSNTQIPIAPPCNTLFSAPSPFPVSVAPPYRNPSAPIVPTPTIQTPVSYIGPPPTFFTPSVPKAEPIINAQTLFPLEPVAAGCGQPLDSASLATLIGLLQQANLGVTSLPAETVTQLELPGAVPAATPDTVDVAAALFDFPQFGQATSPILHPWGRVYEPMKRLYQPHLY